MKRIFLLYMLALPCLVSARNEGTGHNPGINDGMHTGFTHGVPVLNINNVTVVEDDGLATLTISLSGPANRPVRVYYKTDDGTARHPRDYKKENGVIVIPAGSLSASIDIKIIKDNKDEATEYFKVRIRLARREHDARMGDATGRVTIKDEKKVNTTSYVELNNLVVVYTNTNGGTINDTSLLRPALRQASDFYWRHSHMAFNIKWTVYLVDEYLERVHENGYVYPGEVDADLRSRGYADGSFDAVVAVVRGGGSYAWGVNNILGTGCYFQVPQWDEHYLFSWFFVHEFHHIVDAMFANSGHVDYPHNHPAAARAAGEYVPHSGSNWDLNAEIIRYWPRLKWYDLQKVGKWGDIKSAVDNDLDTIPDNDSNIPLDEKRFGSSSNVKDTDQDGLPDLQEAMAGIFLRTDPKVQDTEGDGLPDGEDSEPVYPLKTIVPQRSVVSLAQDVTEWPLLGHYYFFDLPGADSASLYSTYTNNPYTRSYFYVGFKVPVEITSCRIVIDANNDGLFYGRDNYEILMNGNTVEAVNLYDAPNDTQIPLLPIYFAGELKSGPGWSSYQVVTPLGMGPGQTAGIYIEIPVYAAGTMFEPDDFLTLTMGEPDQLTQANKSATTPKETKPVLTRLTAMVYPNPSAQSFTLQWKGSNQPVSITITDAVGKVVQKRTGLHSNGSLQTGNNFRPGIYYAEVVQGKERTVVKLVKN